MTTKASMGLNKITVTVCDGSGAEICVAVGKKGLTSGSFQIFKSEPAFTGQAKQEHGYVFSKGTMSIGFGTCKCQYALIKGGDDESIAVPLYDIEKVGRMGLCLTFTNPEDTVIAKYAQPGMMDKINIAEIGAGVDYVAVLICAGLIGAATGSGNGAMVGAIAGAGAI